MIIHPHSPTFFHITFHDVRSHRDNRKLVELTSMAEGINYFLEQIQQRELQLKNAVREAEAANKAKSLFIANMSHEIRTPMNAIINLTVLCLEAPLDTRLDSKRKGWLEIVRRSSKSLLNLTNDILDSAKVEAGRLELDAVIFSLTDLLDKFEPYQIEAKNKGLDFAINVQNDIPGYWIGDCQRLGQVLINLVSNAIKFTQKGTVEVEVALYRSAGEQGLLFEVCDSGIGIREDKLENVFTPFNQADNSTTRIYGGTGLGLTISRQLVELMGGRIQANCKQGAGCVFQVALPLEPVSEEHNSASDRIFDFFPDKALCECFSGRVVLLVEDNTFNQIVAEELLTLAGIKVDLAKDGIEAVEMVTVKKYDLILMDLHMPRMDGFEAGIAIRDLPDCAELPIIILTADANSSTREQCFQAGMDDIITKPLDPNDFFRILQRWLNGEKNEKKGRAARIKGNGLR
ncbi:MAG: response regulator [Candidatus Electrothrix sp. AR4]|nr:response regulator [Candidatus Electrothrix sp. AR4]